MANGSVDGGNPAPPDGSTLPDTSMTTESSTSDVKVDSSSTDGSTDSTSSGDSSDGGGPG
jgi:hypothetical protein